MKILIKHLTQRSSDEKGFSLIELMFALAIASILMMVSMPFYQNYKIRTKISSEIPLARPLMTNMAERYSRNGEWPSTNTQAGGKPPEHYQGKYLMSVNVTDSPQEGSLTLTYDADKLPVLRGTDTIVFYPSEAGSSANWNCDQGTIPFKYRPARCH